MTTYTLTLTVPVEYEKSGRTERSFKPVGFVFENTKRDTGETSSPSGSTSRSPSPSWSPSSASLARTASRHSRTETLPGAASRRPVSDGRHGRGFPPPACSGRGLAGGEPDARP